MTEALRREIFRRLVQLQDTGCLVVISYRLVANRFRIREADVRQIAEEGLASGWVEDLASDLDPDRALARGKARCRASCPDCRPVRARALPT